MSKIKILYTIPNFDTAGSGRVVYDLMKRLDKTKFEVEVACQHDKGAFFSEVKALGLPIHILDTTVPYLPYTSLLLRLRPLIHFFKAKNYDIIHSWHWSSDWTEALAARLAGINWIYTKKAMSWGNRHWKIRSYLAHYIITINDEMKNYFPWKKCQKLIPIGIDTEFFKPSFKNNFDKNEIFKIITVANLVPVKGIEVLLKTVELMKDDSVELKIVGDHSGEYGQGLIKLCKKQNLVRQIKFTGKVSDVRPFLEEADIYVIPTLDEGRKEGMPMALVEAMSMAVPVLGSDISGINFVLKDFPELLFQAGNSEVLMKKLEWLRTMEPERRKAIGNSLRTYCENHYRMEISILEHEKLYNKIVNG